MAEGPQVKLICDRIRSAVKNEVLQNLVVRSRKVPPNLDVHSLVGAAITGVESLGKNIIIALSNGYSFRVHLMMFGRCEIYRPGEKHALAAERVRLALMTKSHHVVAFNAPIVELMPSEDLSKHPALATLGPDGLHQPFDRRRFIANLTRTENLERSIGEALLDQSIVAGVGNIYKCEILFRARIHAERKVARLKPSELTALSRLVPEVLQRAYRHLRMGRHSRFLVYGRAGRPCVRCGWKIQSYRQQPSNRITYACPKYQPSQRLIKS